MIIIKFGFFVINTFLVLLFLELIELNIFNLSDNTKQNIEQRAILDKQMLDICDEESSDDEIESTETNEEEKRNNKFYQTITPNLKSYCPK